MKLEGELRVIPEVNSGPIKMNYKPTSFKLG